MRAVVFETDQFLEDIVHHGLQKQYELFREKVERGEVIFDSIAGLKKTQKLEYNLRLLAWDGTTELFNMACEPRLILFLKLYVKKEKEYEQLANKTDKKGRVEVREKLLKCLTPLYKEQLKNDYLDRIKPPAPVKEPLPLELHKWLELEPWQDKTGLLNVGFCESQLWSREIKVLSNFNSMFYEILLNVANHVLYPGQDENGISFQNLHVKMDDQERYAIFYSIHRAKQGTIVFLVMPVVLDEHKRIEQVAAELGTKFKGIFQEENLRIDDVFKYSRQAYPVDTVLDRELWFQIENDEEAHPALSTEEENILLSISGPEGKTLPIFINGRAGSGKSTLLQLIFCLFARKHLDGLQGSILYLTYSEQLRKNASDLCRRLLKGHYNFASKKADVQYSEEAIEGLINNSFSRFHDFLLQILPEQERKNFAESRKVTFYHFKNHFYPSLRTPVKCSPETAWHVIRAYIKGRESDAELKPEEYGGIEAKDQTVAVETYRIVFEKVWPQYRVYLAEQQKWDDLDLVRRVLWLMDMDRKLVESAAYTAIFCDEAQDFTKNELSLILRMSVFSRYNLGMQKQEIQGLPFAFAGDPLQTLTPTGFKWDRFRSTFYDVLKEQLDIKDPKPFLDKDKMVELQYNYRSNEGIVKFSNVIQFLRLSLLGENCLPQKCWRGDEVGQEGGGARQTVTKYFIFAQNLSEGEFIKHARLSVIILPSEEGGLDEFIQNDPVLKEMKEQQEGEIAFEDAVSSKGLEMDKVIIYKFGHFLKDGEALWDGGPVDEGRLLYFRYFFNRLYVAVTRARKQLNIVDTKAGFEQFWSRLVSEAMLKELPSFEQWNKDDCFEYLLKGTEASDLHEDNPLNVARMYREAGIKERNPRQMAKAASIFSSHGESDVTECWAYEKWFSGKYEEAGQLFSQIRANSEQARDCFWEGAVWAGLEKWYGDNSEISAEDRARRQLARFLLALEQDDQGKILEYGARVLQEDCRGMQDRLLGERYEGASQGFLDWLESNVEGLEPEECRSLATLLEDSEDPRVVDLTLQLHYRAGEYLRVVELSEEYDREDERYYKSRLELAESVEEKISCLLNLGQEEKVMELYQQEKDELKSRHLLQDLQKLYAKRDNIDEVLLIHLSLNKYIEAWHELIRNYERVSMEFKKKHLKILLTEAIRRGLVKQLFADVTKLRVTKTELVLLLLCEVVASKQTDSDDLMLTHKLVNDFFEETNPLVVEKFDNNQLISASLAYERIDCRRKDLLPFYEELLARGDLEPKTKRFIRERWLYIKSKHTDDRSRYKKEARQELDERQNEWQIQKIPTGIPYLEDVVKRFGGLKKDPNMAAAPAKQEIQLKVDVDRNFEYEDILEGDFNEKKNEFRIQLNLKTKPEQIVVEIGDKRFNLPLKG